MPLFASAHQDYKRRKDKDLPVYLYKTYCDPRFSATAGGNPENFGRHMASAGISFTTYDLTHGSVDYYSLPNLCATMSANRFGIVDKIMACPLLDLKTVLGEFAPSTKKLVSA
jgi:hypothetical protein